MKKVILLSLVLTFTVNSFAQNSDKKWGAAAALGGYGTTNNGGLGLMPELYLSRYLSPKLDLMLKGDLGIFNSKVISKLDIANPFLNLRYKLAGETKNFRPYLYAGPGFLSDNDKSGFNFNLGVGAKYYVGKNTAFYADAGYIDGIDATILEKKIKDNFWKATVGLEYDFGKAKDTDRDGVPDKKDNCPDTPPGVAVDAHGCPVDTDGDGVPDYIDDCPTVAGLTSLKGCPDKDGDGIADKDDACPDVAGLVSLKGCPDTDGDGVADNDDKCPDTPKGWKVDATGCPLDQDKDGVPDAIDNCPTVPGPKENKGCPVKEPEKKMEITSADVEVQDIKVQPIHFVSDKSYLTDFSKGILDKIVKLLNDNKDYNVNIFGYTDSRGSESHNLKLSADRAKSAADYIESKGISKNRILQQKAFGESKPVDTNRTEAGRLKNRRVEFEIFKMK